MTKIKIPLYKPLIKKNSNELLKNKKKIRTREKSVKNFVRLLWKNLKRD